MGLRAASPVLVGRHGEMGALLQALEAAVESGSASVLVGGEAGVGKTRLIHEFGGVAERHGALVCIGRCLKFGDAIWPLAPLGEILAGLSDKLDDATLDLVIGNARGVLARLEGDVGDGSQGDTIVSSEQLCQLLVGMFGRLAERRPLVLVVEDLHWADDTTRLLFSALARAHRVRPLLLIGTFRSDELHVDCGIVQDGGAGQDQVARQAVLGDHARSARRPRRKASSRLGASLQREAGLRAGRASGRSTRPRR